MMNTRLLMAITLASSLGLSACASDPLRVASASPNYSAPREAAVTTPDRCPSGWASDAPVRHLGESTPFSDRSLTYEGC